MPHDERQPTDASSPDPWEDTETAHLRAFLKLTYTERFHLLMQALEFMGKLRPEGTGDATVDSADSAVDDAARPAERDNTSGD